MKRAGPLKRTPMPARRRPLRCNVSLTPGPPLVRSKPKTVRLRRPPMDPRFRAAVFDRCQGRCDKCGKALRPSWWKCHHRKLRSQGGTDEMPNCVALHERCHSVIHENPAWAYWAGFLVRSNDDPAKRPVWHRDKAWRLACKREWVRVDPSEMGQVG